MLIPTNSLSPKAIDDLRISECEFAYHDVQFKTFMNNCNSQGVYVSPDTQLMINEHLDNLATGKVLNRPNPNIVEFLSLA